MVHIRRKPVRFRAGVVALAAVAMLATGVVASTGAAAARKHSSKLQNANIILDFYFQPSHAALAYGITHGIFAKYGINLSVTPGTGSGFALQEINQGRFDFALCDMDSYTIERLRDQTQTTAIYAFTPEATTGILSTFPIHKITDLEGHTYVTVPGSQSIDILPYLLKQHGINPNKVPIKTVSFSVLYSSLFAGRIQMAEWDDPGDQGALLEAQSLHKKVYTAVLRQFGLNTPARVVLVRDSLLRSDPQLVRNFLKGLNASMQQAYAAPISAIVSALKNKNFDPQVVPEEAKLEWDAVVKDGPNYGAITTAEAQNALNLAKGTSGVKSHLTATSLYSDKYLP